MKPWRIQQRLKKEKTSGFKQKMVQLTPAFHTAWFSRGEGRRRWCETSCSVPERKAIKLINIVVSLCFSAFEFGIVCRKSCIIATNNQNERKCHKQTMSTQT